MKKLNDIVIYQDERFYAAFPSVVTLNGGEMLVAFRRAPDRRRFLGRPAGHNQITHCDPNSQLVVVRSWDQGRTWTSQPELIYAHPFGGSQDPCMVHLPDNTVILTSYAWMLLPEEAKPIARPNAEIGWGGWTFTFLGGFVMRSNNDGADWEGPVFPPLYEPPAGLFAHTPVPVYNRGAMTQGTDERLYWVVTRGIPGRVGSPASHQGLALAVSSDRGLKWEIASQLPHHPSVSFNETSLVQTPRGDLVAFVRTEGEGMRDHGVLIRSRDLGRTWEPWQDMQIVGHPYHALKLRDGRVLLVYGYRHKPYGIRARVLDAECADLSGPEIILREDGGTTDIGYPWAALTADGRVLVTYYFNVNDGPRGICGTFLEVG